MNFILKNKYKLTTKFLFFVVSLCLFGCNKRSESTIELDISSKHSKYSDIFEFQKSILLQDAIDFGQDVEVFITDNTIIILDKDFTNSVYYYNFDGRLILQIDSGIGGPDEFTEITDATYDFENDILYIFSEEQYSIFGFNNQGNVIKNYQLNTDFYVHEIEHFKEDTFVFYAAQDMGGKNQVQVYDFKNRETKLSFLKGKFKHIFLSNETNLWKNNSNNTVYIAPYFTNYIYKIKENLQIDSTLIEGTLDLKKVQELAEFNDLKNYAFKNKTNYFVGMFKESSSMRTFIYYNSKIDEASVYLKNLNTGVIFDPNKVENDLIDTDYSIGLFVYLNDENAYTLNSSEFFQADDKAKDNLSSYFGDSLNRFINEDSYSILNIYKIKK